MSDKTNNAGGSGIPADTADTAEKVAATAIPIISNWAAMRDGTSMTISGWDNGKRIRITGVAEISADSDGPLATLKTEGGQPAAQYRLA